MKTKELPKPPRKLSRSNAIKYIDAEIARLKSDATFENVVSTLRQIDGIRKQAQAIEYNEGIVESYLARADINFTGYGVQPATKDYRTALKLAVKFSYSKGKAYATLGFTRAQLMTGGDSTEAIHTISEVLTFSRKHKDEVLEWWALTLLCNSFNALGELSRGYSLFEQALEIAERRGIKRDIVKTITEGASTLQAPLLYERHLRRAAELADAPEFGSKSRSYALYKYAAALHLLERYAESDTYLDRVIEELPTLGASGEGNMRATIGSFYIERGLEKKAYTEFERALVLGIHPRMAVYVNAEMGRMSAKTNPQLALRYFQEGLSFANQDKDLGEADRLHGLLAEFYSSIGDPQKAVEQYSLYKAITEQNKKRDEKQRADYAEMILRFDELQKHDKQLTQEVEEKSAALASKAMLLAEQTELLSSFRNDLRALLRKVTVNDPAINEIRRKLRDLPESVNWKEFDEQFQSVHPQFRAMLGKNYPSLSKMEIKNCVLVRLGLNSREISKILSLSKRTTEWHRHNIRLKLGINADTDIAQFLQAM